MADELIPPPAPNDESHKQAADENSSAKGGSYSVKEVATPNRDGRIESDSVWLWGLFDAGIILLFWGWSEFFGSHNSPILSNVFFFGFVSSVVVAIGCFTFKHWPHLIIICLFCILLCGVSGVVIYKYSNPLPPNPAVSKRIESVQTTQTNPTIQEEITYYSRRAIAHQWQPPELPKGQQQVSVKFGGVTSRYEVSDLSSDRPFVPGIVMPGGIFVTPYIRNNRLYVKAPTPFGEAAQTVQMNDDWPIKIPDGWDRNYDPSSFEIVNEKRLPVIQIRYVTAFAIEVNGVFVSDNGAVTVAFGGHTVGTAPIPGLPIPDIPERKAWFKYPSKDHLGELASQ